MFGIRGLSTVLGIFISADHHNLDLPSQVFDLFQKFSLLNNRPSQREFKTYFVGSSQSPTNHSRCLDWNHRDEKEETNSMILHLNVVMGSASKMSDLFLPDQVIQIQSSRSKFESGRPFAGKRK